MSTAKPTKGTSSQSVVSANLRGKSGRICGKTRETRWLSGGMPTGMVGWIWVGECEVARYDCTCGGTGTNWKAWCKPEKTLAVGPVWNDASLQNRLTERINMHMLMIAHKHTIMQFNRSLAHKSRKHVFSGQYRSESAMPPLSCCKKQKTISTLSNTSIHFLSRGPERVFICVWMSILAAQACVRLLCEAFLSLVDHHSFGISRQIPELLQIPMTVTIQILTNKSYNKNYKYTTCFPQGLCQ